MRRLVIRMLSTILLCSVLTTGCANGMNEATAETKTIYDDYRDGHFGKYSLHEMFVNIPDGWSVDEYSDDNVIYCHPDYGLFNIYCCEPDIDITELGSEEHPIISKGLAEAQTIEYMNSTWSVRDYMARSMDTNMVGFWAETIFNEHKYLIFACSNSKVDRNTDIQKIMDSIYFEEDLSMYIDGSFEHEKEYPIVTMNEAKSGEYEYMTVAIEGVVGHLDNQISHGGRYGWIEYDMWFLENGSYNMDNHSWVLFADDYTEKFWNSIKGIDEGDRVRLYCLVEKDNYIGSYSLKWMELLEKGNLESSGIVYEVIEETKPVEVINPTEVNADDVVYITNSGSRYHTATCRWVSDSCIEISLEAAISSGYTPCGTCNPSG